MGIHKLPNCRMYWGRKTCVPFIADTMSRNRFEEVLSILHFNDNEQLQKHDAPNYDRLHKLRPLLNHFRTAFKNTVQPETCQAIYKMIDGIIGPFWFENDVGETVTVNKESYIVVLNKFWRALGACRGVQ